MDASFIRDELLIPTEDMANPASPVSLVGRYSVCVHVHSFALLRLFNYRRRKNDDDVLSFLIEFGFGSKTREGGKEKRAEKYVPSSSLSKRGKENFVARIFDPFLVFPYLLTYERCERRSLCI